MRESKGSLLCALRKGGNVMGEYKKVLDSRSSSSYYWILYPWLLGTDVYHQAPPVPTTYVSQDGQVCSLRMISYMVNRHGNLQVWSICRDRTRS